MFTYHHKRLGKRSTVPNPYENRWRSWYPDISDWIVRNPGGKMVDCARELNKHPNTINYIMGTDIFKEFHAQRRAEWQERHDHAIRTKLTSVADASLDILLGQMEKKKDQIPMKMVQELAVSALDRLGYLPSAAAVQVNVDNRSQTVVVQGVSAVELEEARMAMRQAEQANRGTSLARRIAPDPYEVRPNSPRVSGFRQFDPLDGLEPVSVAEGPAGTLSSAGGARLELDACDVTSDSVSSSKPASSEESPE